MPDKRTIHIVSFDVPFPPDYGGVTDIYFRCRALKNAGFRVILHCFEYGRGRSHDPSEIADEVFYYSRRKSVRDWFSSLPFIVKTRNAPELLKRLLQDDFPIVFEGQHTTFFLDHPALADRKKLVRLHNVEWKYYEELARRTQSLPKQLFFRSEARKLKQHEKVLKHATLLGCITHPDTVYYRDRFHDSVYIPVGFDQHPEPFLPLDRPPFVLFHGNLSVPENHEAALWILEAFREYAGDKELIIAGKQPHAALTEACNNCSGITLIADPSGDDMQQLIQSAEAHLAISFQRSGIKLKLLNALVSGKPCIATPEMVAGSDVEELCTIVESREELLAALAAVRPLTEAEQEARVNALRKLFPAERFVEIIGELE